MRGLYAATFSIVGRCKRTKHLGVAVATKMPAVGGLCPFVRHGVGAVSSQAWLNPYLAVDILDRLAESVPVSDGLSAEDLQAEVDAMRTWIDQRTAALAAQRTD